MTQVFRKEGVGAGGRTPKLVELQDDAKGISVVNKKGSHDVIISKFSGKGRMPLAGKAHPETGVMFDSDGVPIFESKFNAKIEPSIYLESDSVQFESATSQLNESLNSNSELREQFTSKQLEQISRGIKPSGYTWHHNQEEGVLQLVDEVIHRKTGDIGGRSIWGGGKEFR